MIDVANLRVRADDRTICSVSKLQVARGERVAILGSNGSGKTTLLRVLAGLETRHTGSVSIIAAQRQRAYVHQIPHLFRGTVLANVTYGLRQQGMRRIERDGVAREWLVRLGIESLCDRAVTRLSGGERRRAAIARAMVLQPELLLLDEPFADLDEEGTRAVVAAIDDLPECTVLIASPKTLPVELIARSNVLE